MKLYDLFFMAVKNLYNRKLRTFLTSLGVVMGVAAIIIMVSIGIGINKGYEEMIGEMGDITVITIHNPNTGNFYYEGMEQQSSTLKFDDKTIASLKKIDGVKAVSPQITSYIELYVGKYRGWGNLVGMDLTTLEDFNFIVADGRNLEIGDKMGILAGTMSAQNFYDLNANWRNFSFGDIEVDLMNDKILMHYDYRYGQDEEEGYYSDDERPIAQPYIANIVGVLAPKDYNIDTSFLMDYNDVKKLKDERTRFEEGYGGGSKARKSSEYDGIMIKCVDINAVEGVSKKVEEMGFYPDSAFTYLEQLKEMSRTLQTTLGITGFIVLFVAAIGIANTMITSMYERIKEIGIMKVIGASLKDIGKLFLIESALIGLVGGCLGLGLSYAVSYGLNYFNFDITGSGATTKSVIPIWLSLFALAFSFLVGLISGYFPARRAMKLSALDAIKTE